MKISCSHYNPYTLCVILGLLFLGITQAAHAQCRADFSFQATPADNHAPTGKIEVSSNTPVPGICTFKVYELKSDLSLVETKRASASDKVVFENLKPSSYFVKIEWGDSCYKTLGGFDGIIITAKDEEQ